MIQQVTSNFTTIIVWNYQHVYLYIKASGAVSYYQHIIVRNKGDGGNLYIMKGSLTTTKYIFQINSAKMQWKLGKVLKMGLNYYHVYEFA